MHWVHQLLTTDRQWNAELIRNIFTSEIATAILQLQLEESADDIITWMHEKRGDYSVSS
ncbi:hypothetical protein PIB30_041726, partial [Stylosanthes scabra]|nr:hypothetical protein [Stylosanthes scabra]